MATPYTSTATTATTTATTVATTATTVATTATTVATPSAWEMRSVTPATNNTRYNNHARGVSARYESPARTYDPNAAATAAANTVSTSTEPPRTPSSTGLIRLSLKKPMGIVFEPMYDPQNPSIQRGVRICDLPRTGAAALSRKLQVGDELLQINDTTVSRMTFDEIMDFIIEADPESVNLLFRRPRKETLQARQGVPQKLQAATNNPTTVKWVDEETDESEDPRKSKKKHHQQHKSSSSGGNNNNNNKKKSSSSRANNSKKSSIREDDEEEEETLQSSTGESYQKSSSRRKKKKSSSSTSSSRRYESESFLDLLIDTICSNSNNMCRDAFRKDEYSDDESLNSELDEETYTTYEESVELKNKRKKQSGRNKKEDVAENKNRHHHHRSNSKNKEELKHTSNTNKKYEDDNTLETVDTRERQKEQPPPVTTTQPPLGLAPNPEPVVVMAAAPSPAEKPHEPITTNPNPAPIQELEYDDRIDHGADVSVMESLGGPSLLIEKQRAAAQAALQTAQTVPDEILQSFGLDYPAKFGMTREQSIQNDPLLFYTYVVKKLLEQHEPEKVRLLDKLLAKYKGREDHLVQKLSVRYNNRQDNNHHHHHDDDDDDDDDDEHHFTNAVQKTKASSNAVAAVNRAKDRLLHQQQQDDDDDEWPAKEHKQQDDDDDDEHGDPEPVLEEEISESGSEYSRDSVDGTSPAVIAQVSELLNYVYGKTSVPGQIDRVSTIMRAYEGREAVLLELLETKALIKANKEKENADNLPAFLRNTQQQAQKNAQHLENDGNLPPVTPMATMTTTAPPIHDDISSMSGVSSPVPVVQQLLQAQEDEVVEVARTPSSAKEDPLPMHETKPPQPLHPPNMSSSAVQRTPPPVQKPPTTPGEKKKKKGLFGGLFSGKRTGSRSKRR